MSEYINKKTRLLLAVVLLPLLFYAAIHLTRFLNEPSPELDDPTEYPTSVVSATPSDLEGSSDPPEAPKVPELTPPFTVPPADPKEMTRRSEAIKLFVSSYRLKADVTSEDWDLALRYVSDMKKVFDTDFMIYRTAPKIGKIATYGIRLLSGYAKTKNPKYLDVVEDLITRLNDKLNNVALDGPRTPWNQSWYDVSVRLTRMLATYELLGTNDAVKAICHRRILQITPKLNESLGCARTGFELAWIACPRLLTNYIYDVDLYDRETNLDEFADVRNAMSRSYAFNSEDGIHLDRSCLYNKVATYWPLVETGEFYDGVFQSLGFPSDNGGITEAILNKILHPDMDFVPFGLFGRVPRVTCADALAEQWPTYVRAAELKVHVCPLIGLGVFKSERFAFWVRVQRDGVVAYESDNENFEFAAGWIQMRKVYQVALKDGYKKRLLWSDLRNQPGVISYAEEEHGDFDRFKPEEGESVKQHFAEVIESYVGQLGDHARALYWKNKYKFKLWGGDTVIDECGVCTDNGVVVRTEIDNQTGRTLSFRVVDDDNDGNMRADFAPMDLLLQRGAVLIENGARRVINSTWVFDRMRYPRTVELGVNGRDMTFRCGNVFYTVETYEDCHIVTKDGKPVLAGNAWTFEKKSISWKNKNTETIFELDSTTLMFKPK